MTRRPLNWLLPGFETIDYNIWHKSGNILFDSIRKMDKATAMVAYVNWIEQVKSNVPPQQLLVHNAKEGWPPICRFLELEGDSCPSNRGEKYPHVNEGAEMKKTFSTMKTITDWFDSILGAVIGIVIISILNTFRKSKSSVEKKDN